MLAFTCEAKEVVDERSEEHLSTLDQMTPKQVAAMGRREQITVGAEVRTAAPSAATVIHVRPASPVRATQGSRLTITAANLTPELEAALRHAATIHNPAFYEAQRARRSTWNTPRFIKGFDVAVNGDVILPRGLREQVKQLIVDAGSSLQVDDDRSTGTELEMSFTGELSDRQTIAVDAMLAHEDGILQAPTGSGKTVMACAIIAERAVSTLVLISKTALAAQWRQQIQTLLGIKAGQLGGGRSKVRGQVDIMLLQTLARQTPDEIRELTSGCSSLRSSTPSLGSTSRASSRVLTLRRRTGRSSLTSATTLLPRRLTTPSRRSRPPGVPRFARQHLPWPRHGEQARLLSACVGVAGVTATPQRKDGLEAITSWQLGPIRHTWRDILPAEATLLAPYDGPERILHIHETAFSAPSDFDLAEPGAIAALGGVLAADTNRNRQIADDITAALAQGRKCLVLSRRRDHLEALASLLPGAEPLVMQGGTGKKVVAAIREKIADAGPSDPLLVMTTVPYGGEGFDAPAIDTVFLIGPISFTGLLIQAVGRALRRHDGKRDVIVHDYVDAQLPVLAAQYSRRRAGYQAMGFNPGGPRG